MPAHTRAPKNFFLIDFSNLPARPTPPLPTTGQIKKNNKIKSTADGQFSQNDSENNNNKKRR
jgi:hypothetical protein